MGGGRRMFSSVLDTNRGEDKKKYWERRGRSDTARENVRGGLDRVANFQVVDLKEAARSKRDQAINERSRKRDIRENKEQAREDFYRRQMRDKRRENDMRKSKQEMGDVGVLGGRNSYGDDAVWNNETRNWEPNTKANNLAQWNAAKARSDANQGGTNLFGQAKGTNFAPGSSSRGTLNDQPQTGGDNRDFKKLYEELLKIQNAGKQ